MSLIDTYRNNIKRKKDEEMRLNNEKTKYLSDKANKNSRIISAKRDLIDEHLYDSNRISMGRHIQEVFGENTGKAVFSVMAEKDHKDIKDGVLKVSAVTGALASTGTIKVMANHHHGA